MGKRGRGAIGNECTTVVVVIRDVVIPKPIPLLFSKFTEINDYNYNK